MGSAHGNFLGQVEELSLNSAGLGNDGWILGRGVTPSEFWF